jgi:hypothetical protein
LYLHTRHSCGTSVKIIGFVFTHTQKTLETHPQPRSFMVVIYISVHPHLFFLARDMGNLLMGPQPHLLRVRGSLGRSGRNGIGVGLPRSFSTLLWTETTIVSLENWSAIN